MRHWSQGTYIWSIHTHSHTIHADIHTYSQPARLHEAARLQLKPRISHRDHTNKQKPSLQKGFDSFILKVHNTADIFFE